VPLEFFNPLLAPDHRAALVTLARRARARLPGMTSEWCPRAWYPVLSGAGGPGPGVSMVTAAAMAERVPTTSLGALIVFDRVAPQCGQWTSVDQRLDSIVKGVARVPSGAASQLSA
jgi:hypothetical protein